LAYKQIFPSLLRLVRDEGINVPIVGIAKSGWNLHPRLDEMDAYERGLGDAMAGDATLFAREDYVEEAWRIVDPVPKANTPIYEYEPNTWDQTKSVKKSRPLATGKTRSRMTDPCGRQVYCRDLLDPTPYPWVP
jgi:glucose-6-phosphate 1-dehydrogenase